MKRFVCAAVVLFSAIFISSNALALESPFSNLERVVRYLKVSELAQSEARRPVKIAILDNGFRNFELEIGKTLPKSTVFHAGPVAVKETQLEAHGTVMAQIVAGLLDQASNGGFQYELHLYSAFGYSNLNSAISDAISRKVDVILYSQVWEYGGFGAGRGFINRAVSHATAAGILWINASGNFAKGTYQARIAPKPDGLLDLPAENESVRVRCDKNKSGKCQLRAVLSWSDFNDDVNVGTDKDLNFELTDTNLKVIRLSALQQRKEFPEGQQGLSKYPREIIEAELTPGNYLLRIKMGSNNFGRNDQLRITVSGPSVTLLDQTREADVLNPADNTSVITVGASDSDLSSSGASGSKPEVKIPSMLELKNGEVYKGSSNSAAMFAAVAAIHSSIEPNLNRETLLKRWNGGTTSQPAPQPTPIPKPKPTPQPAPIPTPKPQPTPDRPVPTPPPVSTPAPAPQPQPDFPPPPPPPPFPTPDRFVGRGLPLETMNFRPTGPGCFLQTSISDPPAPLIPLLRDGAIPVKTSAGKKVFVTVDPLSIIFNLRRTQMNDMVVATDAGYFMYPRVEQKDLPAGFYEVVQVPAGHYICDHKDRHPVQQ